MVKATDMDGFTAILAIPVIGALVCAAVLGKILLWAVIYIFLAWALPETFVHFQTWIGLGHIAPWQVGVIAGLLSEVFHRSVASEISASK